MTAPLPRLLIMGGGIAGNFAAAWLRRHVPELRVTVVGRTDRNPPIVGESLVEFSTFFLQTLGFGRHLVEEQLPKYGLSFYYKLDPSSAADPRYVVDEAPANPPFPSFLINRFSFDEALRRFNLRSGVEYVEGKVARVDLGDGQHRVTVQRHDGETEQYTVRWLIDATGRRRLLARQLGLGLGVTHQRSAFWFRLADFDPAVLERIQAIKKVNRSFVPYYAAHHFFGRGNWIWLLPVRGRDSRRLISVGITWRPDLYAASVNSTDQHPVVSELVRSGSIVDSNLYRNYMYRARQRYSSRGWFVIGDAADSVDPLYSTGLALVAVAVQQVGALIRRDLDGGPTAAFAADLDAAYAGFHGLSGDLSARLYEVMQDGFQCHLRMKLNITTIFHMAMPLLFTGYHTDPAGAALMARMAQSGGLARQLTDFDPLIARAAARLAAASGSPARHFVKVQSGFSLNHPWFEHLREDEIPRSLSQLFRYMARLRLRLFRMAGVRSWFDRLQLGALLRSLAWAAAARGCGKRSLKDSRLIRWMVMRDAGPAPAGRSVS